MGVQKYPADIREQCIKLRNDGLTFVEIAARLDIPYWKSVARIFYTNGETSGRLMSDEEKQTIIDLYENGYSVQSIAEQTHRSVGAIRKHLTDKGFIIVCDKSKRESKYAEMREYKAQGHTIAEVAERFGVSDTTATKVCKGIAPQKCDYAEVSKKLKGRYIPLIHEQTEERLKTLLCDEFEWAGGYTCSTGYVTIRCKQCGTEFERSAQAIRKQQVKYCPKCRKEETERNATQRELEREEQKALRDAERERIKLEKAEERKRKIKVKTCVICGQTFETTNGKAKCCSAECSKVYQSKRHDRRFANGERNKAINARSLFKRDDGTCWICGGKCNLNDYVIRDGAFIAGDWYPSVDHIFPVYLGGSDTWDNVKLAHRLCNRQRYIDEKDSRRKESL